MTTKIIEEDNLDEQTFGVIMRNGVRKVRNKFSSAPGNLLQAKSDGLFAGLSASTADNYAVTWAENMRPQDAKVDRGVLRVKNGIGILHLDFSTSVARGKIGTLPSNAPTSSTVVEVQVARGSTVGSIWLDPKGRTIYHANLPTNTRIIVDLIGFFD